MLADIIRQMQEDKGKGGEQKSDELIDIIDVYCVDISLKSLQESITAVCLDKLGFTWDIRYGELIKYKQQYGDCNVPSNWLENKQLGNWTGSQRSNYRNKILSSDRIRRLENIGFSWTYPWDAIAEKRWESMFDALTKYMKNHGNCNFINRTEESIVLARWANMQRENYQFKRLTDIQIKRLEGQIEILEDIGFAWNPICPIWEKMFNKLKEYKNNNGDCNVPANWVEANLPLGQWVSAQRKNSKNQKHSDTQIKRLKEIGF